MKRILPTLTCMATVAMAFLPFSVHAESTGTASASAASIVSEGTIHYEEQNLAEWQPKAGDQFIADTDNNIGYLMHTDNTYVSFLIATGQRRTVHYIGTSYNAATPVDHWTVKSKEIQGDRTTFGPQGHFLRLYRGDSESYTHYGIHTHKYITKMLGDDVRYKSMGCILVSDEMLAIIEKTLTTDGGELHVTTVYGPEGWNADFAAAIAMKNDGYGTATKPRMIAGPVLQTIVSDDLVQN